MAAIGSLGAARFPWRTRHSRAAGACSGAPGPGSRHRQMRRGLASKKPKPLTAGGAWLGVRRCHLTAHFVTNHWPAQGNLQPAQPPFFPHPPTPGKGNFDNFFHASITVTGQCPDQTWAHTVKSWEKNQGKLQQLSQRSRVGPPQPQELCRGSKDSTPHLLPLK